MRNKVSMNLHQGYDAKAFCEDAVSNCSAEPELLEWTEEIHNSMSILVEGVRGRSIDVIEVSDFLEFILSCTDAMSEIENAIAISFIEFNELLGSRFSRSIIPIS